MTTSFHKNWWAIHRIDDCLNHGTALPERSASVGLFSGVTPVLEPPSALEQAHFNKEYIL